jgi:aminoglycoside phosphotransferase (APT) family kinase protein
LINRDDATRRAIAELETLHMIDAQAALRLWKTAVEAPRWDKAPVWVHGDIKADNVLVRDGALCAVIDFGGVGYGDPACDLQIAWNFMTAPQREIFREAMQADAAMWLRGMGWALSVAVIALPYYKDSNPALAEISRHTIAQVLAVF